MIKLYSFCREADSDSLWLFQVICIQYSFQVVCFVLEDAGGVAFDCVLYLLEGLWAGVADHNPL